MGQLDTIAVELARNNDFKKRVIDGGYASNEEELVPVAKRMLHIETVLMAIYNADLEEIDEYNALILFQLKTQALFFDSISDKARKQIRGITLYRKSLINPSSWKANIEFYKEMPSIVSFFKFEDGKLNLNNGCRVLLNRLDELEDYLDKFIEQPPCTKSEVVTKFTDGLKFTITLNKNNEFYAEDKEILPYLRLAGKFNQNLKDFQLGEYESKQYGVIHKNDDTRQLLDDISKEPGTLPNIKMNFIETGLDEIVLNKVVHVLGGLGVGKTNFKFAYTKHFIERQGLRRIAIIEDKVSTVLQIVSRLRALGIEAIPVIGQDDGKHLIDYVESLEEPFELDSIKKDEVLGLISGFCPIEEMAEQYGAAKINRNYCESFVLGKKRNCICPLASECGKMERYRRMKRAQVWVLTSAALMKTKIPTAFNPKKKSMFEIVYDHCDLVFIDEVDGTQAYLDAALIETSQLFEVRELSSDLKKLEERLRKSSESSGELSALIHHMCYFVENVNHFNDFSNFSRYIFKEYRNNSVITPRLIVSDIERLIPEEKEITNELKEIARITAPNRYTEEQEAEKSELLKKNLVYTEYAHFRLIRVGHTTRIEGKYSKIFEAIDKFLNEKLRNKSVIKENDLLKLRELILFFFILIELDLHYKRTIYYCELIRSQADENTKISGIISGLNELSFYRNKTSKFTYEPLLDNNVGYRISTIDEAGEKYSLKVFSYTGVGRQLIRHLNNVKGVLGKDGPGVIALSGTSFLPASAHFNFNVPVSILLTSEKAEGEIRMHYIPIIDDEVDGHEYIRVSGLAGSKRDKSLKKMVSSDKFKKHLDYAIKKTGKKVLIVVPSYDTSQVVKSSLEMNGYKTLCLVRKDSEDRDDSTITIAEVEKISRKKEHEDKMCLIVGARTIYRGYNILDENKNSYFGAAFFLSRPYINPHSYTDAITVTHAFDELWVEDYLASSPAIRGSLIAKMKERDKKNQLIFDDIYKLGPWYEIGEDYRKLVSAFAFAYIKQMIGRMQRNQNECLVYFVDASFCLKQEILTIGQVGSISMFDYWRKIIEESAKKNKLVAENLYGEFYKALDGMIEEIENGINL